MSFYRKYLEPRYGDVAPEVKIGEPQIMDMDNAKEWRLMTNRETIAEIEASLSGCSCYENLRSIRTEDIKVYGKDAAIPVRIYYPAKTKNVPIMVFSHGGSFSMNNIDVYDYVNRYFAAYGDIAVVSADYRLAPEYPFPCGLSDCYYVLEWAAKCSRQLGGSPDNIVVCGDSSGGNFAAVLAMMARDYRGPSVKKQVLIYPVTALTQTVISESELRYGKGYFLEYERIEDIGRAYVEDEKMFLNPYLSPLYAESLKGLPPAGFFSAECDPLLDQGLMYAARLADSGTEVQYHIYEGMIHGFLCSSYKKTFDMLQDICRYVNGK